MTRRPPRSTLFPYTTLFRSQPPAETEIVFAGLVDEECGQLGSRKLAGNGFKADLAIVGEPTRLDVVTAHKGVDRKSTRLNSSHSQISYAVFCLKKKTKRTRS